MKRSDDIPMKRGEAAELLDLIRTELARRTPPEKIEQMLAVPFGPRTAIPALRPCNGDAHSEPNIDNCGVCAPRWGWVGPRVRVK